MGFLMGLWLGLLTAIVLFGFLIYWLCRRSNNIAVGKLISGIVQALAHKPKSPEPLVEGNDGEVMEENGGNVQKITNGAIGRSGKKEGAVNANAKPHP